MSDRRFVVASIFLLLSVVAHGQTYMFGRADFTVGNNPTSIAAGDFNGDGLVDYAVTNSADKTVSILLGKPNGTFAPQVTYATGPEPVAVVTGDFNGDGNLDLAVSNGNCKSANLGPVCSSSTVSILLGNGDGTFQAHIDFAVGKLPSSLVVADFNGDGKLDLAIANAQDGTVSVLLGNGDGTFQSQVVYATAGPSPWEEIVVGDFNGDGKLDLAVSSVSVLLGNGDGTFRTHLDSGGGVWSGMALAAGDFNRDGKMDLVVGGASRNILTVLLGNGDGTFSVNATYIGSSVAVADLNGDGKLDLVVTQAANDNSSDTSVSVMRGNGDGTFQAPVPYGAGYLPMGLLLEDVNGDGKLDIAVADSACPFLSSISQTPCSGQPGIHGTISVLLGFGDGTFAGRTDYGAGNVPQLFPSAVTSADFNHDGTLDLATNNYSGDSISVFLGKPDGTFQQPQTFPAGPIPQAVATGDFRNNGILDLVSANQTCYNSPCNPGTVSVLLGNGDGTFQPHLEYGAGLQPVGLSVGDFRSIGELDLAVANLGSATVSILLGNGDGTFQQQVSYATAVGNPQQIVVGDFNGDGKLDLAVATGGNVSILLGNGDGTFKSHVDYPAVGGTIAAGDFNGDGKLDLAVGGISTASSFVGAVSILLGNGDGTFQSPVPYLTGGLEFVNSIAVSDFNQDGKLDVAAGPGVGTDDAVILLGNGDGTFQQATVYLVGEIALQGLTVGDFNGDGTPDWAAPDSLNQTVGVMLSAAFKAVSPGSLNFGSQGIGTTSAPQTITISNPSNVKFTIASISPSANFAETNTCGASLSPSASCSVTVTFSPTATGSQSGTITITDNTRISPLAIAVRGIGVNGPFLSTFPARQNFSPQIVGTAGNPAAIVLANTGNASLTITGISIAGTNSSDFSQTNNCGNSLSAGSFCTVNVTFMPTAGGSRIANLTIADSAPGGPNSATLEGTGLAQPDFSIGAASGSPTSQTISAGQTASFSLALAPTGSFTGTVNLTCAITPTVTPAPICSLSSSSVQISGSGTQPVTVKVATIAASTGIAFYVNSPPRTMPLTWCLILLGSTWLCVRNHKRLPAFATPILVLATVFSVGCGSSGSPHTTPGTPAGTYTATITASSASLSHIMALQVVVR